MPQIPWEQLSLGALMLLCGTWIIVKVGAQFVGRMFDVFNAYREDGIKREQIGSEDKKLLVNVLQEISRVMADFKTFQSKKMGLIEKIYECQIDCPLRREGVAIISDDKINQASH